MSYALWFLFGCLAAVLLAVVPADAQNSRRDVRHVTVASEPDRFKGWPANYGMWRWGDEILVTYVDATYQFKGTDHSVDRTKAQYLEGARSRDGGVTWAVEKYGLVSPLTANYTADIFKGGTDLTTPINFADRDTVVLLTHMDDGDGQSSFLYYSTNRGVKWSGPYNFPQLGFNSSQARTDVEVVNRNTLVAYVDGQKEPRGDNEGRWVIRTYKVITEDGGLHWRILNEASRIVPTPPALVDHTIMSSTVRLSPTRLVSASRNWTSDRPGNGAGAVVNSRMELWQSDDNGATWKFKSTIRDYKTPDAKNDGKVSSTPPALTKLPGGRLVVTYGHRLPPYGVRARISGDGGATWGDEIVLRDDGFNFDLGYTRNVVRGDGKIVTAYYFRPNTSDKRVPQRIEATIWSPGVASKRND